MSELLATRLSAMAYEPVSRSGFPHISLAIGRWRLYLQWLLSGAFPLLLPLRCLLISSVRLFTSQIVAPCTAPILHSFSAASTTIPVSSN